MLLVRIAAGHAARSSRAEPVVGGRAAPCPFCGSPIDADGHLCPRANGFRRRELTA